MLKYFLSIVLYIFLSSFYKLEGENLKSNDSLKIELEYFDTPIEKVEALLNVSSKLLNDNPQKALEFTNQALEISKTENYSKGILNSYMLCAKLHWRFSDFKEAMDFVEKAKRLALKLETDKELAECLRIEGLIFIELSNFKESSDIFFKSLKIFERLDDKDKISELMSYIGSVHYYQHNFDKALNYYIQALDLSKKNNNIDGIARDLNNIAAVYETTEDYEKAAEYFEKASDINLKLGNRRSVGVNYMNIGTVNFKLEALGQAKEYFDKALVVFKNLNSEIYEARCYVNIAKYYLSIDSLSSSLKNAKLAMNIGVKKNLKKISFDAAEIIHEIFIQKGDTQKAYKYLDIKFQLRDSLIQMKNKSELAKLELQFEFDKRKQLDKIAQQQKDRFVYIVIISLLLLLISVILVMARLRVKSKNALLKQQELKYKLEFRNKELTTNVLALMKKNEMLSSISDKLMEIKNKAVKSETKYAISKITTELQDSIEKEMSEEFEQRFNQVHSDFYDKLLKKFPNLTPSELRLSAFLRLNMSTKEISELTGQRVNSLETARYRLRKKLKLTNSQVNLITFLSKI